MRRKHTYKYTGREFKDKDFEILDLNLFGGLSQAKLKGGDWIDVAPHASVENVWLEVVETVVEEQ